MNSDLQQLAERLLNEVAGSLPERDQTVLNRIAKRAYQPRSGAGVHRKTDLWRATF